MWLNFFMSIINDQLVGLQEFIKRFHYLSGKTINTKYTAKALKSGYFIQDVGFNFS